MPRRKVSRKRGRGIGSWLKKAHSFIKKHKVISRVGTAFVGTNPYARGALLAAKTMGYGPRLAGAGTLLAGARYRHRHGPSPFVKMRKRGGAFR